MLFVRDFKLDAQELLRSIDVSVLVLDVNLRIRFMTPSAAALLDVEDGAVGSRAAEVPALQSSPGLIEDARAVLVRGQPVSRGLSMASGTRMVRHSRPYQHRDQAIQGVVITFASQGQVQVRSGASGSGDIADDALRVSENALGRLTERQREIMNLVLEGHPSKRIAAVLGISARTVENHRASIMHRTGCRSLPELTRLALQATYRSA